MLQGEFSFAEMARPIHARGHNGVVLKIDSQLALLSSAAGAAGMPAPRVRRQLCMAARGRV
jgi:hypothetical protein